MNSRPADTNGEPEAAPEALQAEESDDHSSNVADTEDPPHLNRAWPEEDGPIPPEPIGPGRDRVERINGNALAFGLNIGNHF